MFYRFSAIQQVRTEVMDDDINDLGERLKQARTKNQDPLAETEASRQRQVDSSGLGLAMQMAVELVAAVLIGGGVGFALDHWFGTRPVFMVIFLIFGCAAGLITVIRTAQAHDRRRAEAKKAALQAPENTDGKE